MNNKKIGSFISECRKSLGMTQQQLADMLGVSNKAISKWETGEGYPDILTIPELCKALEISADEFFAGEHFIREQIVSSQSTAANNSNDPRVTTPDIYVTEKVVTIRERIPRPAFPIILLSIFGALVFFSLIGTASWVSVDSQSGETAQEMSFPNIPTHIEPQEPADINAEQRMSGNNR